MEQQIREIESYIRTLRSYDNGLEFNPEAIKCIRQTFESNILLFSRLNQFLRLVDQRLYLDFIDFQIDYSFIKSNSLQETKKQLENDNLQMVKAKTNNNFLEFCRFSWFQIETVQQLLVHSIFKYDQKKYFKACRVVEQNITNSGVKNSFTNAYRNGDIEERLKGIGVQRFIELCLVIISNNEDAIFQRTTSTERDLYVLFLGMNVLRNIASHRDTESNVFSKINKVNYRLARDRAKQLYEQQQYKLIKDGVMRFAERAYQWIPTQVKD